MSRGIKRRVTQLNLRTNNMGCKLRCQIFVRSCSRKIVNEFCAISLVSGLCVTIDANVDVNVECERSFNCIIIDVENKCIGPLKFHCL